MKKLLMTAICILALGQPVLADFKEHFDLGQQYLSNYQYSGAITEFKSALRINYLDSSARIGLINSYAARGTYYANTDKNWQKAADDYRSALFYLAYYPNANSVKNSAQAIAQISSNLNKCLGAINFDDSPSSRFRTAKQLRAEGNFSAAGYEFNQTLGDRDYIKDSFAQVGDIMKLLGNDLKAAEYYKKAIAIAPTDIDLRMSYAKLLDKLDSEDAAVEEYNYILTKVSDNKDVLYSLERIYKKKLESAPNDAIVTSNLGAIMQKQGNYDEALRYYSKAEYLDPSNINTRINVGTLYQQKGDYRTALTAYDSVLILYPDNAQANLYKAQTQEALGDTTAALNSYKKVLSLEPDNEVAKSQTMTIVRKTMTTAQFIDYVKHNQGADAADTLYDYALEIHKQNKIDDAITLYNEVLKLNATDAEVYVNLAIAQGQQKKYDLALATLNTANTKFPDNTQIKDAIKSINGEAMDEKLDLAADYYNNKDYKNAINEYLKIQPATADAMLGVASSYQNLNDNANAIEYYKKAFNLNPTSSDVAYYIAALYAEKEDWTNAKIFAQKSIVLNKTNQQAIELNKAITEQGNSVALEKAINLYDAQKYDETLPVLNQILASDSGNSYALYYRGMVYDVKKRYNEAITDYKKALTKNAGADLAVINYLIAVDYDTLAQYKNAFTYYKTFLASYTQEDDFKKYAKTRVQELKQYAQ